MKSSPQKIGIPIEGETMAIVSDFNKSDAGQGIFIKYIEYKPKTFGKMLVKVPPAGTSQTWICGERVPKDLSVRGMNARNVD